MKRRTKHPIFSLFSNQGYVESVVLTISSLLYIPAFLGIFGGEGTHEQLTALLIIAVLAVCLITLVNTNFGLSILIFSMLLSPELEIFRVPQRAVAVRIDDFLVGAVFFTWIAKMAFFKEVALFHHTNLNRPIILYITTCLISTLIGLQTGSVTGLGVWFYILKYFEYFLIFFLFVNNIQTKEQVQKFLIYFLITGVIVSLFALSLYGKIPRLTAPFEGDEPEPASLGGYLLVLIAVVIGLLSQADWPKQRFMMWILLILFVVTLVLSLSRGSLSGFVPLYLVAIILAKRRLHLIFAAIIGYIFYLLLVPQRVVEFAKEAFTGKVYRFAGHEFEFGPTAVVRFEQWETILKGWTKAPILGKGVTGVGLADSQYIRILGETGIVGSIFFIWILVMLLYPSMS